MKGRLKTKTLTHSATPKGTFQLPSSHVSTPHVAPPPKEGGFHRRGFTGTQMFMMMKAFREQIGDSTCGMKAQSTLHNQDEVIIPGNVPIRDIYMARDLENANTVYVNRDFKGPLLSGELETRCLRLIAGG